MATNIMEKSSLTINVVTARLINTLLMLSLLFGASTLYAQKIIPSDSRSAGFRFSAATDISKPIVYYQRDIQMLSTMDDRPTVSVYGDGRVLVHYPVYMKRAGDYEMRLDDAELAALLRSFSSNGLMDYDEKKIKAKKEALKKAPVANGEKHVISDGVMTSINLEFDEYQKNTSSQKIQNFSKHIRMKNIEHDARRFKSDADITKVNNSVKKLKALMKDSRLVKRQKQKGSR